MRLFLVSSVGAAAVTAVLALATNPAPAQNAAPAASGSSPSASATPASCPPLLRHTFDRLQDEKPQPLCQYAGKVVLVVNTASFCGFTPQYKGLEALDSKYRAKGLVVLGFPSNDFSQETGSNKEIADFCENTFGVKFPMFAKSSVRGPDANALFKELAQQSGTAPKWNFYKYLIGRDGKLVASYSSMTGPDDAAFVREIERQIATKQDG
ncbi:glutathione peroxidase [Variovorax sp. J22R133]|uniref:glutathione peroxidase n=1 Tax=Variovorax brevis TaxID=3053503 RepID=UPI00257665EF|nr:glutathione peroxidase [Variovorax sp. J22R133]MDM0115294.1 glutathione peroxidase [Variovorax sp. J22R133]